MRLRSPHPRRGHGRLSFPGLGGAAPRRTRVSCTAALAVALLVPATALAGIGLIEPFRAAPAPVASAAGGRTVKVGDYFLSPGAFTVAHGTRVTWKWLASNGDTHDVKLKRGPRGVTHFHSDYASTGYRFARTLRKPGKYVVICTLHPTRMHQTITVK